MILELPARTERIGAVSFHGVQRVYELDSGSRKFRNHVKQAVMGIPGDQVEEIEKRMAIVVPIKDEKLKLLEGVLSGIPHDCYVIVISNSARAPFDRFKLERQMIEQFNRYVEDEILLIHQKDTGLAEVLREAGYTSILDNHGLVRDGKAEGMVLGILLSKMLHKDFIGFVDADNYVPGAVHEYVKSFAASFVMTTTPYTMSRIYWASKPKVSGGGFYFPKMGRISELSNTYLNRLLMNLTGFGTDIIKTGNSGEHAMSLNLAERLRYTSGFSVEVHEIMNVLEEFGAMGTCTYPEVLAEGVEVFQIETRNPHFHEEKGQDHLNEMFLGSVGVIAGSRICPDDLKEQITEECEARRIIGEDGKMPYPSMIAPPREINIELFSRITDRAKNLTILKCE